MIFRVMTAFTLRRIAWRKLLTGPWVEEFTASRSHRRVGCRRIKTSPVTPVLSGNFPQGPGLVVTRVNTWAAQSTTLVHEPHLVPVKKAAG
jgi:hypothetical protein